LLERNTLHSFIGAQLKAVDNKDRSTGRKRGGPVFVAEKKPLPHWKSPGFSLFACEKHAFVFSIGVLG